MTVVETMSSSFVASPPSSSSQPVPPSAASASSASSVPPPPGGVSSSSSVPPLNGASGAAPVSSVTVPMPVSVPPPGLSTPGGTPPVVVKAREEILTSLHLIKDIRRLETYQRDFFLKVKESLNHVQLLLDHQLMDMAWSDNLIDCEESLLKASAHLGTSSPSQISELYTLLIQDREKLNHRFQELSVKSSLSEYVVNSRTMLNVDMVHVATEAILRNEKPVQPKPDKIPVDHTFFLANFCTTSIASSMFASFMPKREGYRGYGEANNGVGNNNGKHNQPAVTTGASGNSTATTITSHNVDKSKATGQQTQAGMAEKNYYGGANNNNGSSSGGSGGLYNGGDLVGRTSTSGAGSGGNKTASASASTGQAGGQDSDLQKSGGVFSSHELVAAISQITRRPNETSPNKPSGHSQQNVGAGGKNDPWTKEETELMGEKQAASGSSVSQGNYMNHNGYGAGTGNSNVQSSPVGLATEVQGQQQSSQQPHDASNESVTSESDDGRPSTGPAAPVNAAAATAAAVAAYNSIEFDSKPLSFARIASLGLEKATGAPVPAPTMRIGANAGNSQSSTGHMTALGKVGQQQQLTANMTTLSHPMNMGSGIMDRPSGGAGSGGGGGLVNVAGLGNSGGGNSCSSNSTTMSLIPLPPSNNPRYFFDIAMEGKRLGRVIIEVQPTVAPKMSQNFGMLVNGDRGFGYKGCHFFQAWKNESVICGDWEHNSGRGGRAALDGGPLFTPDETRLPCIRGAVGMRRMSKKHSSLNQVASQFRIILANMNTQFTGIFGHVVAGIEALDKVANIGGEGGRPEKVASVVNCGIYKT